MSLTLDAPSAITAAKARVASANGRNATVQRTTRGKFDPKFQQECRSELTTAVIACAIITNLEKNSNLTVPQRVELIGLLMPSDRAAAEQIIGELRDHAETAALAYGGP